MANNTPIQPNLNVRHNFEGDGDVLNATIDKRTILRKTIAALAQDLQRDHGNAVQIQAEIKLQVGGSAPKEHVYTVSVTGPGFDAAEFARAVPSAGKALNRQSNGQQSTPERRAPPSADLDDEVMEIRPFKRQKMNLEPILPGSQQQQPASPAQAALPAMPNGPDETLAFLRTWHDEWTRQGGWLFDTITKSHTTVNGIRGSVEKKLDAVQDVLGQSMNASSASTMAELGSITKLIHWLEHCRKTSADKVQAREEKWRSSSATFHDSARREREAAEKRIEKKLDEQNELLAKLARINGIDDVLGRDPGGSEQRSREESLGAQLTAELNNEAGRSRDVEDDPFNANG